MSICAPEQVSRLFCSTGPSYAELDESAREALLAFTDFEGPIINDALRKQTATAEQRALHDALWSLAGELREGSVLWRGGHWAYDDRCAAQWTSCTLDERIAQHFRDRGGWDADTSARQVLMRIVCKAQVMAIPAAYVLSTSDDTDLHQLAQSEMEIILAPSTHFALSHVDASGIYHVVASASDCIAQERLRHTT